MGAGTRKVLRATLLASVAATVIATKGWAQTASPSAGTGAAPSSAPNEVTEVVVTAEKRNQRVVDVPSSLTVLSGDQLASAQIRDTTDLVRLAPSLSFTQGIGDDGSSVKIRGIGTQVFSIGVEPSVSYIVDGVVQARESQALSSLADVERIEILKGPQSTLFGKNASAGVISIVTKGPTPTQHEEVSYTYAEGGDHRFNAAASGPITDTLGYRVSVFRNYYSGFLKQSPSNRPLNGVDNWGVRGKMVWKPIDRLTVTGIIDYKHQDDNCCEFTFRTLANPSTQQFIAPIGASNFNRYVNINAPVYNESEQTGASINAEYALDNLTLTSITSYRWYTLHNNADVDDTPLTTSLVGSNSYTRLDENEGRTKSHTITQEFRLSNNDISRLEYVLGAFVFNTNQHRPFTRVADACAVTANATRPIGTVCPLVLTLPAGFDAKVENTSVAGFGDATLHLLPQFSLIGGVRLNYETLDYNFSVYNTRAAVPPVTTGFSDAKSVDDFVVLGRAGAKLELGRRTNLFALYSHGYKGYAFDLTTSFTPAIAALQPVAPETSNAYELNLKSELFGRRLTATASLFRTDYDNFQVQAFDTTAAAFRLLNAGSVRTEGVELEATLRPLEGLSFNGAVTYAKARVQQFPGGPCFAGQPVVASIAGAGAPLVCSNNGTATTADDTQNLKGGRLPNSPDWRYNFGSRYEHPVTAGLSAYVDGSLNGQSNTQFALNQNPGTVQKSYTLLNASVGVRDRAGRWEASLFVRNIGDKHFAASLFEAAVNNSPPGNFAEFLTRESARYAGVRLAASF